MSATGSQAALFESLCDEYAGKAGVTVPDGGSGFGSNAIKINKSMLDGRTQLTTIGQPELLPALPIHG